MHAAIVELDALPDAIRAPPRIMIFRLFVGGLALLFIGEYM